MPETGDLDRVWRRWKRGKSWGKVSKGDKRKSWY